MWASSHPPQGTRGWCSLAALRPEGTPPTQGPGDDRQGGAEQEQHGAVADDLGQAGRPGLGTQAAEARQRVEAYHRGQPQVPVPVLRNDFARPPDAQIQTRCRSTGYDTCIPDLLSRGSTDGDDAFVTRTPRMGKSLMLIDVQSCLVNMDPRGELWSDISTRCKKEDGIRKKRSTRQQEREDEEVAEQAHPTF